MPKDILLTKKPAGFDALHRVSPTGFSFPPPLKEEVSRRILDKRMRQHPPMNSHGPINTAGITAMPSPRR